jgi:hypothetical protein
VLHAATYHGSVCFIAFHFACLTQPTSTINKVLKSFVFIIQVSNRDQHVLPQVSSAFHLVSDIYVMIIVNNVGILSKALFVEAQFPGPLFLIIAIYGLE